MTIESEIFLQNKFMQEENGYQNDPDNRPLMFFLFFIEISKSIWLLIPMHAFILHIFLIFLYKYFLFVH